MAVESLQQKAAGFRPIKRVAMVVVHSNPLTEPGAGDAGGMTVYVRQMAKSLAALGVQVDVYTRRDSLEDSWQTDLYPGVKVIQVEAGSTALSKNEIPAHLPEFTSNLISAAGILSDRETGSPYDIIHSHYWLSGRVASILKGRWDVPFVHTFHTLGLVKNRARRSGDPVEPDTRLDGEARVIADACAIVASTGEERQSLIDLYAAHPERIKLISPGVDHQLFRPGRRADARRSLGLGPGKMLLFVGRLQPLKAADTAIRALARLRSEASGGAVQPQLQGRPDDPWLLIVGSPSGEARGGELDRLRALAANLEVEGAVRFIPAQAQQELPKFYQAADVCIVPSLTESFGLVALEAQACGVPVVASRVGGLKSVVKDGVTGFLVAPGDCRAFAKGCGALLSDARMSRKMGTAAAASSLGFSWDRSAEELHDLYALSNQIPRCRSASL